MTTAPSDLQRRALLQIAAGIAAASQLGAPGAALAAPARPQATGKPGDFDFLTGNWHIKNRRLKGKDWDAFDGEASVVGILAGVVSVEELRMPARDFGGMGLRSLDLATGLWADFWVNRNSGVVGPQATWGSFVNGVGTWDADEIEDGKPVIVRGVWDQITPESCRWYQAVSRDQGKTWEENWVMHFQRIRA